MAIKYKTRKKENFEWTLVAELGLRAMLTISFWFDIDGYSNKVTVINYQNKCFEY